MDAHAGNDIAGPELGGGKDVRGDIKDHLHLPSSGVKALNVHN